MYLSGMSILGIVKELERQGIKSPTAKINGANEPSTQCSATKNTSVMPLSLKPTVSILPSMREFKIMIHSHEQFLLNDDHLPIISKEVFDAVQEEKARRSNIVTDESGKHRKDTRYSSKDK